MPLWKSTAKLVGPIELKLSGSSKGWIVGLFRKFRHELTPYSRFYRPLKAKMAIKIRNLKMAISRWKKRLLNLFLLFCLQNSKLYDICLTSKDVHPPFKGLQNTVRYYVSSKIFVPFNEVVLGLWKNPGFLKKISRVVFLAEGFIVFFSGRGRIFTP